MNHLAKQSLLHTQAHSRIWFPIHRKEAPEFFPGIQGREGWIGSCDFYCLLRFVPSLSMWNWWQHFRTYSGACCAFVLGPLSSLLALGSQPRPGATNQLTMMNGWHHEKPGQACGKGKWRGASLFLQSAFTACCMPRQAPAPLGPEDTAPLELADPGTKQKRKAVRKLLPLLRGKSPPCLSSLPYSKCDLPSKSFKGGGWFKTAFQSSVPCGPHVTWSICSSLCWFWEKLQDCRCLLYTLLPLSGHFCGANFPKEVKLKNSRNKWFLTQRLSGWGCQLRGTESQWATLLDQHALLLLREWVCLNPEPEEKRAQILGQLDKRQRTQQTDHHSYWPLPLFQGEILF